MTKKEILRKLSTALAADMRLLLQSALDMIEGADAGDEICIDELKDLARRLDSLAERAEKT